MKKKSKLPEGAKKLPHKRLAEGEVTGHSHRATARSAALYDVGGTIVLDAPQGTEVVHEEHGTQVIPPGQYDRTLVQEFDPFSEEIRDVRD